MKTNIDFRSNNTIPNPQTDHEACVCVVVAVDSSSNETD